MNIRQHKRNTNLGRTLTRDVATVYHTQLTPRRYIILKPLRGE